MMSDVLADAIEQIDRYLSDQYQAYSLMTRVHIRRVQRAMEELRQELDTPPSQEN
jgi:hypothetical protein